MRKKTSEEKIRFGLHLKAMKDELPHGEFIPWIETTYNIHATTAQRYMRTAKDAIRVYDAVKQSL